jgi:hypothetical protein
VGDDQRPSQAERLAGGGLLGVPEQKFVACHPRERALIVLLAGCGLRLNEARELRLGDLDWNERTLRVRGETSKSRRDRLVDVPADVAAVLHRYARDHRAGERSDDAPLFTTRSGKAFTLDGFGKVFTKIKERSGIVDFSAHLLRHTWATNFRRAGSGDIFDLQEQGGWKRLEMVRRYTKQRPREERLRAPSPLGVLAGKSLTQRAEGRKSGQQGQQPFTRETRPFGPRPHRPLGPKPRVNPGNFSGQGGNRTPTAERRLIYSQQSSPPAQPARGTH